MRPYPTLVGSDRSGLCQYLGPVVRTESCATCSGDVQIKIFDCDHPEHVETSYQNCKTCVDFEPRLKSKNVRDWAVGITTAPREISTLARTLSSLKAAGWDAAHVFAEPDSNIPSHDMSLHVVKRDEILGAWPNWYLGLTELFLRIPRADAYFMLQDDVILCRNLRPYLESALWPHDRIGMVSVYRSSYYGSSASRFEAVALNEGFVGALALVFSNAAVRALLSHRHTLAYRMHDDERSLRQIDTVLGTWCKSSKMPALVHSPSLAQHIGETSVIWEVDDNSGKRTADDFPGEEFDCLSLLDNEDDVQASTESTGLSP